MTELIDRILELAVQIQQIPAPSLEEAQRAAYLRELFAQEKLDSVSIDAAQNVFARFAGQGPEAPLIVSAHMDTVFAADTSLHSTRQAERIYGPGIGDNSLGVAALFGLLWRLRERARELPGDVWLVANTGEEGLGDLRGMKAVVDRFGGGVRAYLVVEGLSLGHVYHRAIGVRRYRVTLRTPGGHSWSDFGAPSAVHEAAKLVARISALPVPASPRTTFNVGKISGGTGVNVLAAEAAFELDLRSERLEALQTLVGQVEEMLHAAHQRNVVVESQMIGARPAGELAADHPLVKLAQRCLAEQGLTAELTAGSTDANVPLSRGYPALVLGVTTGGGAHTVHEYIETGPVEQGIEQLVSFVRQAWDAGTPPAAPRS